MPSSNGRQLTTDRVESGSEWRVGRTGEWVEHDGPGELGVTEGPHAELERPPADDRQGGEWVGVASGPNWRVGRTRRVG